MEKKKFNFLILSMFFNTFSFNSKLAQNDLSHWLSLNTYHLLSNVSQARPNQSHQFNLGPILFLL